MFVRQVTLDVQAWHSAPKDEGTAVRRPWWARSVLMAVVVILAWVPFVILQFQSGGRSSSEPMVPKANYDTLNATLTTTTSTLETADRDRNQLKQQLANAQSRLQDVQHQLEEVRRIAHQPPPPPPPEDQIPVNWQPDFQLNWIAGPK